MNACIKVITYSGISLYLDWEQHWLCQHQHSNASFEEGMLSDVIHLGPETPIFCQTRRRTEVCCTAGWQSVQFSQIWATAAAAVVFKTQLMRQSMVVSLTVLQMALIHFLRVLRKAIIGLQFSYVCRVDVQTNTNKHVICILHGEVTVTSLDPCCQWLLFSVLNVSLFKQGLVISKAHWMFHMHTFPCLLFHVSVFWFWIQSIL